MITTPWSVLLPVNERLHDADVSKLLAERFFTDSIVASCNRYDVNAWDPSTHSAGVLHRVYKQWRTGEENKFEATLRGVYEWLRRVEGADDSILCGQWTFRVMRAHLHKISWEVQMSADDNVAAELVLEDGSTVPAGQQPADSVILARLSLPLSHRLSQDVVASLPDVTDGNLTRFLHEELPRVAHCSLGGGVTLLDVTDRLVGDKFGLGVLANFLIGLYCAPSLNYFMLCGRGAYIPDDTGLDAQSEAACAGEKGAYAWWVWGDSKSSVDSLGLIRAETVRSLRQLIFDYQEYVRRQDEATFAIVNEFTHVELEYIPKVINKLGESSSKVCQEAAKSLLDDHIKQRAEFLKAISNQSLTQGKGRLGAATYAQVAHLVRFYAETPVVLNLPSADQQIWAGDCDAGKYLEEYGRLVSLIGGDADESAIRPDEPVAGAVRTVLTNVINNAFKHGAKVEGQVLAIRKWLENGGGSPPPFQVYLGLAPGAPPAYELLLSNSGRGNWESCWGNIRRWVSGFFDRHANGELKTTGFGMYWIAKAASALGWDWEIWERDDGGWRCRFSLTNRPVDMCSLSPRTFSIVQEWGVACLYRFMPKSEDEKGYNEYYGNSNTSDSNS